MDTCTSSISPSMPPIQLLSPAYETMAICGCIAARKNRKNHWVRTSPNSDIRHRSEDVVTPSKRSERPASQALQTCEYLGKFTLCLSSLLPEGRAEIWEKSWQSVIAMWHLSPTSCVPARALGSAVDSSKIEALLSNQPKSWSWRPQKIKSWKALENAVSA